MLRNGVKISNYSIATSGDLVVEYVDGHVDVIAYSADLEKEILTRIKKQILDTTKEYSNSRNRKKKSMISAAVFLGAAGFYGYMASIAFATAFGVSFVPVAIIASLAVGAGYNIYKAIKAAKVMNELKKPLLFARNLDRVNQKREKLRANGVINSRTRELKVTAYNNYTLKEVKKIVTENGNVVDPFMCPIDKKVEKVKQKVKCK